MNKIPVARLWHKKGKLEYYTMFQLNKHFPDLEFEFHIILDQPNYKDEWSERIDKLPYKCYWYSKENMSDYLKNSGYGNEELISKIPNFIHFYHILINHYLRRVFSYEYVLNIEYDVLFNSEDLTQLKNFLQTQTPFSIIEPANPGCDKALAQSLSNLFQQNVIKYQNIGINAGFQGIDLKIFDEFLNPTTFNLLLSCFDFSGIYNEDGTEKTGWTRTILDTQEQSFHSLMNTVSPNHQLLNPNEYYVFPYWVDMEYLKKSKVIHFIGHEKPKEMFEMIDKNLENLI
jgi:hypothetical protein